MRNFVLGILLLWSLIIACMIFPQEYTIHHGREVLLETVPVDPHDLFRGEYVILNYKIAQYPDMQDELNQTVYVVLATDADNIAHVINVQHVKPESGLFLKGTVGGCNTVFLSKSGVCINFGIESYFVKEGEGAALEKELRDGALVKILVDKNGSAKVEGFVPVK